MDIHLVSNSIAVRNGYRDLDYKVFEGKNPDWIWAGNILILPDDSKYEIVKGDNIWFIASRLIRRDVESRISRMHEIDNELDQSDLSGDRRRQLLAELRDMAEAAYSEQLREKINNKLESVE